jgi:quercetin dioxygenase-like cupin family protein
MVAVQTDELELMHFSHVGDESGAADATWPVYRDAGATSTAVVYFELEFGKHLGTHVDSAEEVLVVLGGAVEVVIGEERVRLHAGGVAVVPAFVPHDLINVGSERARIAGVFPANTIVSTFDEPFEQTGGRVVGSPPPESLDEPLAAASAAS